MTHLLPSITICGTARNALPMLTGSLAVIEDICAAAPLSHVIIVTNDNEDGTDMILEAWCASAPGRTLIRLDGLADAIADRVDRLAQARNAYIREYYRQNLATDLMIVLDLDGPNASVNPENLAHAISTAPEGWSGLFANQDGPYYDLYALRKSGWIEQDPWNKFSKDTTWMRRWPMRMLDKITNQAFLSKISTYLSEKNVLSKQYHVPNDAPCISVDSAFGGLAIYRTSALSGAWYGGRDAAGQTICEHVQFNRILANRSPGLFICPSLTNLPPQEHLSQRDPTEIPKDLLK